MISVYQLPPMLLFFIFPPKSRYTRNNFLTAHGTKRLVFHGVHVALMRHHLR
ncbi:unnamed protein product [Ectocarpus sp. CCAP 1310/34]|nr:unnamed protein product [Ectocarpus sp. CCAP 1310/34]